MKKNSAQIMAITAAPPMAIPAIAPVDNTLPWPWLLEAEAVGEEAAVDVDVTELLDLVAVLIVGGSTDVIPWASVGQSSPGCRTYDACLARA
jgi:hypothetical protein